MIVAQPNAKSLIPTGGKRESSNVSNAYNVFNFNQRTSIKKPRKNSNAEMENCDPVAPEGQNPGLNLLKNIYALIKNPNQKGEDSAPGSMIVSSENDDVMLNFEIGKNYKEYFPQNNLETVLESFKPKKFEPSQRVISKKRKKQLKPETNVMVKNFMRAGARSKPFLANFMKMILSTHENNTVEERKANSIK